MSYAHVSAKGWRKHASIRAQGSGRAHTQNVFGNAHSRSGWFEKRQDVNRWKAPRKAQLPLFHDRSGL